LKEKKKWVGWGGGEKREKKCRRHEVLVARNDLSSARGKLALLGNDSR